MQRGKAEVAGGEAYIYRCPRCNKELWYDEYRSTAMKCICRGSKSTIMRFIGYICKHGCTTCKICD